MQSVDPATGEVIATYPEHSAAEIDAAIQRAHAAQRDWARASFAQRADVLKRVAQVLRAGQQRYALLMAREMGKPVRQGRAEMEKCASASDYFADNAESFLAPTNILTEASLSYVTFQPLGAILGIMPWNFPFWQVVRAAAPVLMAGNTFLLKHASNVCGCALALHEAFAEANAPAGVFQTLLASSSQVERVIAHPHVAAVTLTGSTEAGRRVASLAGAHLKKTVLELGGSDPYLVFEDADVAYAAGVCATSRLINTGQSCIAAKRFIVAQQVHDEFVDALHSELAKRSLGDPSDENTDLGPLARVDLREELFRQMNDSVHAGASLHLGGHVVPGSGCYFPATLLSGVRPGMPAFDEETFGPVAAVIEARDEAEAIALANHSRFGLGSAVFSRDLDRARRVADQLQAGNCFINDYVRSDPRLPFGGVKESGYGRELSSFGLAEFVNIKTISVR
jgi:succinate-semialdehyde dehydrogenase / glutarate-semialdehyde dehydrogenase